MKRKLNWLLTALLFAHAYAHGGQMCACISLRTGTAAASRGMLVCGRCVERTSVSKVKTNAEAQTLRSSALGDVLLHQGFVLRPPPVIRNNALFPCRRDTIDCTGWTSCRLNTISPSSDDISLQLFSTLYTHGPRYK